MERLPRLADAGPLPELTAEAWDRLLVADTDLSGIIYYDRYYRYAERGYAEIVRASGADFAGLFESRFATPAVSSRCDYFRPITVDQRFRQVVYVSRTGPSSHATDHHFLLEDGTQTATVRITRATIDASTGEKATIAAVLAEEPESHLARFLRAAMGS